MPDLLCKFEVSQYENKASHSQINAIIQHNIHITYIIYSYDEKMHVQNMHVQYESYNAKGESVTHYKKGR